MLKHLRLQNIILVEQADIPFSAGLNIITGETGAGKSAIMDGLCLAVGERSDVNVIRRGCEKGIIEASFDIEQSSLFHILEEAGIDHEPGQELIIKREISSTGKNRIFINHQQVQLNLLRRIGSHLVHHVGQHANQQLFSLEYHREALDVYGELTSLVASFRESFEKENALRQELEALIHQESQRLRDIDICRKELEELEEAQLKDGEDDELFAEYTLLFNAKELAEKIFEINQVLSGERQPVLPLLHKQKTALEALVRYDSSLKETLESFQNAVVELQEVAHSLRRYQSSLHDDPERLEIINDRMTLINRLKRKYGANLAEIKVYQDQTKDKLQQLENADERIEQLHIEIQAAEKKTHELAEKLTAKRKKKAEELGKALTAQLRSLNMSKAHFSVGVTPQKRHSVGDDRVEFFLQPNVGEHQVSLKEAASGGEVSRVLLALQTLLAGKAKMLTLIFDEIDANIGGETATVIGQKLRDIGKQHQVICVTHFPQVASCAHHHLQISKQEREGRTFTQVQCLNETTQPQELARMLGGTAFNLVS